MYPSKWLITRMEPISCYSNQPNQETIVLLLECHTKAKSTLSLGVPTTSISLLLKVWHILRAVSSIGSMVLCASSSIPPYKGSYKSPDPILPGLYLTFGLLFAVYWFHLLGNELDETAEGFSIDPSGLSKLNEDGEVGFAVKNDSGKALPDGVEFVTKITYEPTSTGKLVV